MPSGTRLRLLAAGATLGVLATSALSGVLPRDTAAAQGTESATVLAVDASADQGTVNPAVLGHSYLWPFGGMGSFDTQAGQFYGKFAHQLADVIQPGSLRWPGGITGETFHWQRAIGPQAQRTPSAFGPANGPSPSTVGPDEYGQLLDQTGAVGVVTANFGTGSAAEAAGFVAYLTAPAGSGLWAALRADNGHPQPYNVPYWEVGNEESGSPYWRSGTPVTVGGPPGACGNVFTCLYIYGGSTRFTRQRVVGFADRTPDAANSTGEAHQSFYVAYPPVALQTATVFVGGTEWTRTDDLATAAPTDQVYTLDEGTGEISFGDGVHGAVPPADAQVTATYVSGPHDGFVQYYQAMKAVNPAIQVCSSDESSDFIASMGASIPYDCLQHHGNYVTANNVANDVPIDRYQQQIMALPAAQAQTTAALEATIEQHAGHAVPLVITEYGQLLSSNPDGVPFYHDSLDSALLNASQLATFIRLGVPVADRQLLTAEIPSADQCCAGLPGAAPFATTGAIGTPGPDSVLEATGMVYDLFAPLAGGTVLPTQAVNDPTLTTVGGQAVPTLDSVAVRSGGYVYLIGINRSTTDAVTAQVLMRGARASGPAMTTLLDGPSSLSFNTPALPQTVALTRTALQLTGGKLNVTFPAHSVMALRVPVQQTPVLPLSMSLSPQPALVAPGGQLTLRATVRNDGDSSASGHVEPLAPDGWTVRPADASYTVPGHATTEVDFQVAVPADAAEGSDQLDAILFAPDGSLADVQSTDVIVRQMLSWSPLFVDTFDDQSPGATPAGYAITGPPGSFTVQPDPSGAAGNALRVQKLSSASGLITATREFPQVDGPSRLLVSAWAAQTDTALGLQLLDSAGTPVVKLSLATAGDIAWTDGTPFVRGATYTAGQWYRLEVDTDPAGGHYKLYINNVLAAQPAMNTDAGAPAQVLVQMPASPATPGTFYTDDISVSTPS